MPCRVDPTPEELAESARRRDRALTGPLHEEIFVLKEELKERDAMLCGVLTALAAIDDAFHMRLTSDGQPLNIGDALPVWYDGGESGVSWNAVNAWWLDHQEKDRLRREQQAHMREIKRREIMSRLSAEEREILGIKE